MLCLMQIADAKEWNATGASLLVGGCPAVTCVTREKYLAFPLNKSKGLQWGSESKSGSMGSHEKEDAPLKPAKDRKEK
jgi:hypothetical protein